MGWEKRIEGDDRKHSLSYCFELLYRSAEFLSAMCLCGQVVIITIAVVGRYVFNKTPPWSEEIARVLMVWMSFLTASMAVKDDSHVRISVFDKIFGKVGVRIRDLIFAVLNIIFSFVLFGEGTKLVFQTARTKLPGSGLSSGVLYASVCVGGLLMALMLIYKLGVKMCKQKR